MKTTSPTRRPTALTPTELAIDRAIQNSLADGTVFQFSGLISRLRGAATAAQVRAAVDRLSRQGKATVYASGGFIYVRGVRP